MWCNVRNYFIKNLIIIAIAWMGPWIPWVGTWWTTYRTWTALWFRAWTHWFGVRTTGRFWDSTAISSAGCLRAVLVTRTTAWIASATRAIFTGTATRTTAWSKNVLVRKWGWEVNDKWNEKKKKRKKNK